jgi:broad specificity phosphatase PhoE
MAIFLIRHGETASNAARIVQTPEVPLSARGIAQAEQLGRRLAQLGVGAILSSDLRRAVMTAERVQAFTGAAITLDAGLQERNFGDVRGRSYADLGVDITAADYEPPGGERWQDFHSRVDATWDRIAAACGATEGNLAVVTHGLVCYSLALRRLQLPTDAGPSVRWHNASVTVVEDAAPWAVRLLNCTAHLSDDGGVRGGAIA